MTARPGFQEAGSSGEKETQAGHAWRPRRGTRTRRCHENHGSSLAHERKKRTEEPTMLNPSFVCFFRLKYTPFL